MGSEFKKIGLKNKPIHHYLPLLMAGLLSACGGTVTVNTDTTNGTSSADTSSTDSTQTAADTTAPTAPTVTSLTTEDTTPTITGTFDASDYAGGFGVMVNNVSYVLGTDAALTSSGNTWSLTIPAGNALALGTYEVIAGAADAAGNAATDSTSNELTIVDTTAPTAPTVTSLATEANTPTITGTFDATDAAGGFTVTVNSVTYTLGSDAELTNTADEWSLTIPAGNKLDLGSYDVVATATDGSGNAATDATSDELVVQDVTAPTVSSVTPLDGATDVEPNTTITASFSEDIFSASVDDTSFTLTATNADSGTVSFDGTSNIATFTPDNGLALAATYTATLTSGITDLVGNGLASDYSWSFTTADGSWGTAEVAENDATNHFDTPSLVLEDNGDAIVVWRSYGTSYDIWANRYVSGSGWGTPELIETNANNAYNPHIAADGHGNAIAVWQQSDGTKVSIWANRYVAGSGWSTAELIEADDAGDTSNPRIAFDGSGNATAVWTQSDGVNINTVANRYTAGSGWGSAEIIDSENLGDVTTYDTWIAASANGDAIAVWRQSNGTLFNIWANRYDAASGLWGGAVKIENMDVNHTFSPRIAMDSSGNATAVFSYYDGSSQRIYANRYVAGSGWSGAVPIDDNPGSTGYPWVSLDDNGNAVVIWQDNGISIGANRYTAGSGWGTPELIDNQTGGLGEETSQVVGDAQGNAIAIWIQDDGTTYSVWSNRYVAGSGWKGAERIESDDTNPVYNFGVSSLAVNGRGQAMAVWRQTDSSDSIWVNRFE